MFDPNDVKRITIRANGQDYVFNVSHDPDPLPGDPVPDATQNAEQSQNLDILSGLEPVYYPDSKSLIPDLSFADGTDPAPATIQIIATETTPTPPADLTPTAQPIGQYRIQHLTGGLEPVYYYPDSKSLIPDLFFADGDLVFRLPWPPAPADAPYSQRDMETFDYVSNEDGTKCGFVAMAEELELDPPSFHQILTTPDTWQPANKRAPVREPIRFYVSNE